jgi:hypothetical protein
MSSLQRALAEHQSSKPAFQTTKGQFENCFAAGLDLTEFGNSSESDFPKESAAAQLLRVKEKEKKLKDDEEVAERRLREVIQVRAAEINDTIRKTIQGNVLVNALVQMHGSDTRDTSIFRKNKKLSKKLTSGRRSNALPSTTGPMKAHKKTHRAKY